MRYSEKQRNALKQVIAKTKKVANEKEADLAEMREVYILMAVFIRTHGLEKVYREFVAAVL